MSEGSHRSSPAARGSAGLAVVTPHAVVLLPGGAPTRVVEDLWRILADPATTAEAVVAALPLRGADEVVSFAVIVHEAVGRRARASRWCCAGTRSWTPTSTVTRMPAVSTRGGPSPSTSPPSTACARTGPAARTPRRARPRAGASP